MEKSFIISADTESLLNAIVKLQNDYVELSKCMDDESREKCDIIYDDLIEEIYSVMKVSIVSRLEQGYKKELIEI